MELRLQAVRYEAQGIHSFEWVSPSGAELPPFTAGAHLDLHLPNGMVRSYSLANDPSERHRYVVAIQRDAKTRGGSACAHDALRVGQALRIDGPRNHFELVESAPHSVFIAGGIGVTPIRSMILRLLALGRSWSLVYAARDRASAAFREEFEGMASQQEVRLHFDRESGGKVLDLEAVVRGAPADAHVYCCGPAPMLEAFERATAHQPADHVHLERFSAPVPAPREGELVVELARTGRTVAVPSGKSILDALLDDGIEVSYSCMDGVCGSCETRVLQGTPDHRDSVLSAREREAGDRMMICCSRAKTPRLVLDL